MKKTIAIVLAMLMVLAVVPFAFAEDDTNETGDDSVEDGAEDVPGDLDDGAEDADVEDEVEDEEETEAEAEDETEEEEVLVVVEEEVTEEAGVTPDSALYGLERAMERISLALTFGKSAKAKKGLAHAHERLMEVQAMIAQKKMDKAAKAQENYEETVAEVEEIVEELGNGDGEEQLADAVEIEEAMAENEEALQALNQIRLKVSNKISAEEKEQLQTMLQSMEGVNSAFNVKVEANKNKAKIKIKAEKGATDEEIAALESALKEGRDLAEVRIVKKGEGKVKAEVTTETKAKVKAGDADEDEDNATTAETKAKAKPKVKGSDSEDEPEDEEPETEE